jgi:flagellar secretion chaperone FliS
MSQTTPLETYNRTRVQTADRGQLLLMVYDAAIRFTREARRRIEEGDTVGKGVMIDKAYAAVAELRKTLNMEQGEEIARSLDRLYAYLLRQITLSNIKSDASALTVVLQILEDLRNTWMQVIEQEDGVPHRSARRPDEVSR